MTPSQDLPLAGIRVLDMTTVVFGPYATQILADFGADVIKVEAPGGDLTRSIGPAKNPGMSALFMGSNRNKRSIELDLKRAPARDALWRLIDGADAFVHNVRPQKIAALGFDPDSVLARNPAIVYGGLHGYREDGPYGGRPAYDDVIQGQSGLAATFTERDGAPVMVPSVVADKCAGLLAANGLMAALMQCQRTGKGVYVEASMFEAMVGFNLVEHQFGATFTPPQGEAGYARALSPERRPHRTKDGYICMLAYTDKQWRDFWRIAGEPEQADDPRYANAGLRNKNINALYAAAGTAIARRTTQEWLALLAEADIPCGPVNGFTDLRSDPHLDAIGFYRPYDHPSEGAIEVPDTAFQFDRQSLPIRQAHPRLNEHGREILHEAGYSDPEIDGILAADKPSN